MTTWQHRGVFAVEADSAFESAEAVQVAKTRVGGDDVVLVCDPRDWVGAYRRESLAQDGVTLLRQSLASLRDYCEAAVIEGVRVAGCRPQD